MINTRHEHELFLTFFAVAFYATVAYVGYQLLGFSSGIKLEQADWIVPFDGVRYIYLSYKVDGLFDDADFIAITTGLFNWASLPIFYWFLNNFTSSPNFYVIVFNLFMLSISLYGFLIIHSGDRFKKIKFTILYVISQPYILSFIFVLNKEIIALAVVPYVILAATEERWRRLFGISILSGVTKIQFVLAYLLSFFIGISNKKVIAAAIFVFGLVYPLFADFGVSVDLQEFIGNAPEEIRSAALMIQLDELTKIPFMILLVSPIRILLNILAGANPARVFFWETPLIALQSVSTLILFLAVSSLIILNSKNLMLVIKHLYSSRFLMIGCYVLVLSFIPFLQSRYYWFLIPCIPIFIQDINFIKNNHELI